jgi:hypothetical protein
MRWLVDEACGEEVGESPPCREQRLLQGVLGVLDGPEHAVAVGVQLRAVPLGQGPEGGLIASPCGGQQLVLRHVDQLARGVDDAREEAVFRYCKSHAGRE